jgi:hypothetical protein
MQENEIPEVVKEAIKDLRSLRNQFDLISYRMGTHGERGLYPKRKSLMSQIGKAEKAFARKFPEFTLVKRGDFNVYYVKTK